MLDQRTRTTRGLVLLVVLGVSSACRYPTREGWRDPMTGDLQCRAAPAAVKSWAGVYIPRRPGDRADLEVWITSHPGGVNARYGADCSTPLHMAARFGREDLAALLLASGADPRVNDEAGSTPVNIAAAYGKVNVLKLLLATGADANRRGANSRTPLESAVSGMGTADDLEQRLEVARILIAAGADVNAREPSTGWTPLHIAAGRTTSHSDQMIQLLLAHGADVHAVDAYGTPLLFAVADSGSRSAVQLWLDRGVDVNVADKNGTALTVAAYGGYPDVVTLLLDRGADVNRRIPGSRLEWEGLPLAAALMVARMPDKTMAAAQRHVAELLMAHGADVNARTETGETLLHRAGFEGDLPAIDLLLSHGAGVAARDASGVTPLHRAAQAGRLDAVARLLRAGADARATASDGSTPLSLAAGDTELEALIRGPARD